MTIDVVGMRTASELALEYWNKPPIERVNSTLQDHVYNYMLKEVNDRDAKIKNMVDCMDDAIRLIDDGNSWDAKEVLR